MVALTAESQSGRLQYLSLLRNGLIRTVIIVFLFLFATRIGVNVSIIHFRLRQIMIVCDCRSHAGRFYR